MYDPIRRRICTCNRVSGGGIGLACRMHGIEQVLFASVLGLAQIALITRRGELMRLPSVLHHAVFCHEGMCHAGVEHDPGSAQSPSACRRSCLLPRYVRPVWLSVAPTKAESCRGWYPELLFSSWKPRLQRFASACTRRSSISSVLSDSVRSRLPVVPSFEVGELVLRR